jgi:predicted metal-binding protein
MAPSVRIGIIICDRYRTCAGGKCLRSLRNREGAFVRYRGQEIELVGYTTCVGCPGGNIEYAPEEMKKNGATVIHLGTGLVVGYPPYPFSWIFTRSLKKSTAFPWSWEHIRSRRSTSRPTCVWGRGTLRSGEHFWSQRYATNPRAWPMIDLSPELLAPSSSLCPCVSTAPRGVAFWRHGRQRLPESPQHHPRRSA